MSYRFMLLLFSLLLISCSSPDQLLTPPPATPSELMYFPPLNAQTWESNTVGQLQWNAAAVQPLRDYLQIKNTKSFMILVNGRIVIEDYFDGHTVSTPWYWASAGKTLTAATTGIAQQQGHLSIEDPVNAHLGTGWTTATVAQENQIQIKHLLSMTSGLDDGNGDCVSPECLTFAASAGSRWAYHNVYVKLQDVVAAAAGQTWDAYFSTQLKNKIGMTGTWIQTGDLSVYWSNTRSIARFGLLMLNNGLWENQQIIDPSYCLEATLPSQQINKSYGYLWWINEEASFHLPQSQLEFPGSIIASGPADMYMALGKNDQKIYVVPSKKMVVIRMGNAADDQNPAVSDFDHVLWQKIAALYE